jgi:hypothetical protein
MIQKRHFIITEGKKEGTKDTKLDVDNASLCALCALFFSLCGNKNTALALHSVPLTPKTMSHSHKFPWHLDY